MAREQALAKAFLDLTATLDDDFDVLEPLQTLVERSASVLGVSTATLLLADQRGDLHLVTSTSHEGALLKLFAGRDGPWVEAFRSGQALVNASPSGTTRWSETLEQAADLGYPAIHVVPMGMRSERLGSLVLLDHHASVLTDDDVSILDAFVSVATIGLLRDRTPRQKELLAEQLQAALNQRMVLEQAKGMVAQLANVSVPESFAIIQAYARREGHRLSAAAQTILKRQVTVDDILGPQS